MEQISYDPTRVEQISYDPTGGGEGGLGVCVVRGWFLLIAKYIIIL